MDFSDFLPSLIELSIPFVGGILLYLVSAVKGFLDARAEAGAAWEFAARLGAMIEDYIEDAATMATGDLAAFRRPGSDGGARITDAELDRYAKAIARRILVEGAGTPWMQRGFALLGARPGTQPADDSIPLQHTARKVKAAIRRREDLAEWRGYAVPLAPPTLPAV